ncbi:MAG: helix-turn-helix transcriptional regulator [Oscillospiraceae bacterium]|nr:helix-turn-helix transcriptional regulator [Oscillospiraceae bacterium]
MKERIRDLRKTHLKLTQQAFADQLGLSQNYVWQIEKGERVPSDRTISDICRIFNVNPAWLRNGAEPMLMPEPDDDTAYINELLTAVDDPVVDIIKAFMSVYVTLNEEDKKKARAFAASLKNKVKESRD